MKLYAGGLAALHVDDKVYEPDENGMLDVHPSHVETALSHGASLKNPATVDPVQRDSDDTLARIATLEATIAGFGPRIQALEALVADLQERAPRKK